MKMWKVFDTDADDTDDNSGMQTMIRKAHLSKTYIKKKQLPKLIKRKLIIYKNFNFQTCNKIYYSYHFGNRQLLLPPRLFWHSI